MKEGVELYERLINWPDREMLTVFLGAALAPVAPAVLLLALGRFRLCARIIGVVAVVMIMLDLLVILEQTETERVGPYITVTKFVLWTDAVSDSSRSSGSAHRRVIFL